MSARILAVDDSEVSLKLLKAALLQAGHQVTTAAGGTEALERVDQLNPDLVILDVSMPEMDGYQVCRKLRSRPTTARVPIMMLTAKDTIEEKVKGFDAGADDYMIKPFQPAELQARIAVLLRRAAPQPQAVVPKEIEGKTVAVFLLRGGVGVSTIAANLAVGLTQLLCTPAALVDLAFTAGHAALMLNLSPRVTWADLARAELEDIEADLINQVLLSHVSGTRVLAAPRRAEQGELLTEERIGAVLQVLQKNFHYVVLDLPHDFREATLAGLDRADEILLVLAPELASVMNASSTLDVFDDLGYPKHKVRIVLNCNTERGGLARANIEEALRRPVNVIVPYAPDVVLGAINHGTPPVIDKPTSEIGMLFEDLAYFASEPEHRNKRPDNPSPTWTRVATRMQQRKKK